MNRNKTNYYLGMLLAIVIFSFGNACAASNTNSENEKADTLKINEYIDLTSKYMTIKPDSAKFYIDSLMDLSIKSNNNYGLFKSSNFLGIYYWMYADFDSALIYYKNALKYAELTPEVRNKALVLGNIGLLYSNLYKSDSAIKYLNETIEYSIDKKVNDMITKARYDLGSLYLNQSNYVEAIKNLNLVKDSLEVNPDPKLNLLINNIIGIIHYRVEDFDQSLIYFNKAIKLDIENEEINILSNIYINIAQNYLEILHDVDSAHFYFNKALDVAVDYNKDYVILNVNIGFGNIFMEEKKFDSAANIYFKVLEMPRLENAPSHKVAALINIGIYYYKINKFNESEEYLSNGLDLAESLKILQYQNKALQYLVLIAKENKQYEKGMMLFDKYTDLTDSLKIEYAQQRLAKLKFEKYLVDQTNNIKHLEKENELKTRLLYNRNILLILLLLGGVSLFIYIISIYISRRKIKQLAGELENKNEDLGNANEELNSLNEELNSVNEELTVQQSKLIDANMAKDKFFTIIGHDLKSPFNSLLGFLSLLNADWESLDEGEKKNIVNKLYNNTLGTYKLLEDLLDWGKTQRGLVTSNKIVFKVRPKLDEIYDVLKNQIEQKGITFNCTVSNDFSIYSDMQLFSHIILNLLNNALKFTPKGGEISIFSIEEKDTKKICVKDNGIGFPNDKIDKVFDFDFNFNREGTENENTSGIGLILCSEYARIMDAKISLESEENEGSTFCISIKND